MAKLSQWLEDRLGYRALLHIALDEPVRGGARWAYVFGSALAVLFAVQALTGIALAAYYTPSTGDAWASVNFIQHQVALGWLLRGMHHFGASAMVILLGAHLLQTLWFGAYRSPRELNWIAGFLLLQLVLAFALTGYLLPWDQKGYWATQVATSIMSTVPLIGETLQKLVQGGDRYGQLTLNRFFVLHVLLLPVLLGGLLVVHVYLFRRRGVTVHPGVSPQEAERRTEPFHPGQLLRDAVAALAVIAAIVIITVVKRGAPLEAPADPSSPFLARPEWYFLPLFQLLKYFEGPAEIIGALVLPGAAMGFLLLLPFLDGLLSRRTRRAHLLLSSTVTAGLVAVAALGVLAVVQDARNPAFTEMAVRERENAGRFSRLALQGVPAEGPLLLYRNDPLLFGERVFQKQCASCHHACATQPFKGDPCLEGYASRDWLARVLRDPQSPYLFGNTGIDEMDAYTGGEEELAALVEFLYAQGNRPDADAARARRGEELFESEGCGACHGLDGEGTGDAPDLKGYATAEWLAAFIRHPDASRYYGKKNKMKGFKPDELKDDELKAVIAYLRAQSAAPVKFR